MNISIDIAALLEPISDISPCGEDLEYSREFAALQMAAVGTPEQQVGDMIVPATEPDWHDVIDRALGMAARTHDLRIACRLTQALLHVDGLSGLSAGLALVRGYLQANWDDLYPRLDAEDEHDPAIRVNALAMLCNHAAIIHPLRERPLLHSSMAGAISLRSIAQANGTETSEDDAAALRGMTEIEAAFAAIALPDLQSMVLAAQQALQDAAAIESELARRVGSDKALDFGALTKALVEVVAIAEPWLARRSEVSPATPAADRPADAPVRAAEIRAEPQCGPLRNRRDVLQALADMCGYFAQHEPGHPVPLLLERARRWITMDYMELLRDLAPEAAEQAERLRGSN